MLSIIIPVYNVELYLVQCLDSIAIQTEKDFEVILVDDGSVDRSGVICEEFAHRDSRFRVYHIKNSGPSYARNFGLSKIKGDLVTFIDSDDWIPENYVETILSSVSDYDLSFFCHSEYHIDGSYISYKRPYYSTRNADEIQEYLLWLKTNPIKIEFCNFSVNKVFRRSIIEANNLEFPIGLNTREDEIFTNKYCEHVRSLQFLPDNLYVYRIANAGLTSKEKSQSQLYLLADEMMKSTNWQSNNLRQFSLKRTFTFFMDGSFMKLFPPYHQYKKFYDYFKKNKSISKLNKSAQLSFGYPLPISCLAFYFISTYKYAKKCLVK